MFVANGFTERSCPYCGGSAAKTAFRLKAKEITSLNWSYQEIYAKTLNIHEEDEFEIVKCERCGFLYSRLLPPAEFLAALYDSVIDLDSDYAKSAAWRDIARRCRYVSTLLNLIREYDPTPPLLDYGAGYGQTTQILRCAGNAVVAYETSKDRISYLKSRSVTIARDRDEIYAHSPYAAIVCDNVLEHVPDPKSIARLFREILRPDGILFVSVPAYEKDLIRAVRVKPDMSLNPWEHLNYFDLTHLDGMLSKYQFRALKRNELGENVDIGLRAEVTLLSRLKNSIASSVRMVSYTLTGSALENVNCRYYRLVEGV